MYTVGLTPKNAQEKIAEQIKTLRKAAGFTQAELAKRAQCSLGSYKRFESTGLIAFDALLRIAFVLKRLDPMITIFEVKPEPDFKKLFAKVEVCR
jgi:transcriptional regulator with XRE-family HTH domain